MIENEDELYPNAAILRAFANSPVAKPNATLEKLEEQRNEMLSQLAAISNAAERERKRITAVELAVEARKRRSTKKDVQEEKSQREQDHTNEQQTTS